MEQTVLTTMLHSLQVSSQPRLNTLLTIMRTPSVPFGHYYNAGCQKWMDRDRYFVLLAALVAFDQWDNRYLVSSVDCMAQCTYRRSGLEKFTELDISVLGSKFLFEDFMATDLPMLSDPSMFLDQISRSVKGEEEYPNVLQSCLLFTSKHVPVAFFMKAGMDQTPNAWMSFHYSCFDARHTQPRRDNRIFPIISWLLKGRSVHEIWDGVDWEALPGIADVTRWSLHLIMILLGFSSHQDTGGVQVGVPLNDHLTELHRLAMSYHAIEQRRFEREALGLLLSIISSGLECWSRLVRQPGHRKAKTTEIPIGVLLGIVVVGLPERLHPTWRLTALSFARKVGEINLQPYHHVSESDLRQVGPIEQIAWIDCYLSDPQNYEFLRWTLGDILKSDARVQEHILSKTPSETFTQGSPQHKMVVESIPLDMRLKVARLHFLESSLLNRRAFDIHQSLCRKNPVWTEVYGPHMSPSNLVRMMLIGMQTKNMYRVYHPFMPASPPICMLELMDCERMVMLGLVLAIAALFGVDTGFPLCPRQLQLLLHTCRYPEMHLSEMVNKSFLSMSHVDMLNYYEGLAVERVRVSQRMAVQILPHYLEWHELSLSQF